MERLTFQFKISIHTLESLSAHWDVYRKLNRPYHILYLDTSYSITNSTKVLLSSWMLILADFIHMHTPKLELPCTGTLNSTTGKYSLEDFIYRLKSQQHNDIIHKITSVSWLQGLFDLLPLCQFLSKVGYSSDAQMDQQRQPFEEKWKMASLTHTLWLCYRLGLVEPLRGRRRRQKALTRIFRRFSRTGKALMNHHANFTWSLFCALLNFAHGRLIVEMSQPLLSLHTNFRTCV